MTHDTFWDGMNRSLEEAINDEIYQARVERDARNYPSNDETYQIDKSGNKHDEFWSRTNAVRWSDSKPLEDDETYQIDKPGNKHDELLAKINSNLCLSNNGHCDGEHLKKDGLAGEWFALRAVVELHKPITAKDGLVLCSANCEDEYPCPTIQAIDKELG